MTTLRRAKNGDWFSRKGIPVDVREAYQLAFGVTFEERFRRPATMSQTQAKAELRDWDATISSRIEVLRAGKSGHGVSLTHRQLMGLVGRWYSWFVAQFEENPGSPDDWDPMYYRLEEASSAGEGDDEDAPLSPRQRQKLHAAILEIGRVASFLAQEGVTLQPDTMGVFLDSLRLELEAALTLLRRRSEGDYTPDPRIERFPTSEPLKPNGGKSGPKLSGLDCWDAFEAWVKERQPGAATVNRWRSVFSTMNVHFGRKDIAQISADDALAWKQTLVTEERSAQVANDVWLRAAFTVFKWAVANRYIQSNPFEGIKIATPKRVAKVREREFTDDEWRMILKATLLPPEKRMARHNAAARRWIPWLCAYTGSRPGEMTQLRKEDIQSRNGLWVINITPEAGTVKGQSARVVPLHAHLIEQGFLTFLESCPAGPLFYDPEGKRVVRDDPTNPSQPLWVKARNKLADWVRGIGVTDPNISPNHAWRHTFKRRAARADIEKRIRFAMCGHSSDDVGDIYETPTVEDMAEAMKAFPRYVI